MELLNLEGPIQTVFGNIQGSLRINPREIVLLVGENGAGKSTLVQALKYHCKQKEFKVSYLDQFPLKSINELTVSTLCEQLKKEFSLDSIKSFLEEFSLQDIFQKKINDLSGGENQVLKLAICLSFPCDFYVLDEPFTFLDKDKKNILSSMIKNKGMSFLIIDHGNSQVASFAQRVFQLERNGEHCQIKVLKERNEQKESNP